MGGEVSRPSLQGVKLSALAINRPRALITDRIVALGKDGIIPSQFLVFREAEGPLGGLYGIKRPTELEHLDTLEALGVRLIVTLLTQDYTRSGKPPTNRLDASKNPPAGGSAEHIAFVSCDTDGSEWAELDSAFIDSLDARFERIHLPTKDGTAPGTDDAFKAAMIRVQATRNAGGSVAVHCWEGWGRTGMFSAAALCCVWGARTTDALGDVVARNDASRSPFQSTERQHAALALCAAGVRALLGGAPLPHARLELQSRAWWEGPDNFALRHFLDGAIFGFVKESADEITLPSHLALGPGGQRVLASALVPNAHFAVLCTPMSPRKLDLERLEKTISENFGIHRAKYKQGGPAVRVTCHLMASGEEFSALDKDFLHQWESRTPRSHPSHPRSAKESRWQYVLAQFEGISA